MLLEKEAILDAAKSLLEMAILDEIEDDDSCAEYPEGMDCPADVIELIVEKHLDDVMLTMGLLIGGIGQAWGHEVGLVFHHMDLKDAEDQGSPLYRLIMNCFGHGIAIDDDGPNGPMAIAFDHAGEVLCNILDDEGKRFKACPTDFDQHQHFTSELVDRHLVYNVPDDDE